MVANPPRGWARLGWLGPGFLWMVSAAGSGELLFTPRIGALHGYTLLWAMLIAVASAHASDENHRTFVTWRVTAD